MNLELLAKQLLSTTSQTFKDAAAHLLQQGNFPDALPKLLVESEVAASAYLQKEGLAKVVNLKEFSRILLIAGFTETGLIPTGHTALDGLLSGTFQKNALASQSLTNKVLSTTSQPVAQKLPHPQKVETVESPVRHSPKKHSAVPAVKQELTPIPTCVSSVHPSSPVSENMIQPVDILAPNTPDTPLVFLDFWFENHWNIGTSCETKKDVTDSYFFF